MKFLIPISCLLLLFNSCTPIFYHYSPNNYTTSAYQADPTQLTEWSFPPTQREVDVYFNGEKPKEAYIKTHLLEEIAYNETSYAILLKRLKIKAQQKGIDGVLILSRTRSESETELSYTVTNILNAVGIKYVRNVKFENEGNPKQGFLSAYNPDNAEYQIIDSFALNENGQPLNSVSNTYNYYFYQYSLDFMLYEVNKKWQFLPFPDRTHLTEKRNYNKLTRIYTFSYDSLERVSHVKQKTMASDYEIDFTYKNGRLHQKKIYIIYSSSDERILKRTELFEYNPAGVLIRKYIFKRKADGSPQPFLKLEYEFYTQRDFQQLLARQVQPN